MLTLCLADARAQYSAALWPASNLTVAAATWTNGAGAAVTGTVKDARAVELFGAARERLIAVGLGSTSNAYSPRWHIWERANVVRLKSCAHTILLRGAEAGATGWNWPLDFFAAPWLADGNGNFTAHCAANSLQYIPPMTPSNVLAHLGIRTNFWDYTPWVALNAREWDSLKAIFDLMTMTSSADIGSTNETQTASTHWEGYWGDYVDEQPTWAGTKATVALGWGAMTNYPDFFDYVWPPEEPYFSGGTNTIWPRADGPASYSQGTFAYITTNGPTEITNWFSASAAVNTYWPAYAAATQFHRAADWYHMADTNFTTFDDGGLGLAPTCVRVVQMGATNAWTNIVQTAVGPAAGFPKGQPAWCEEPPTVGAARSRGYGTAGMRWVLRWDATTNGFRYR